MKKIFIVIICIICCSFILSSCTQADIAMQNVQKEANNLNVYRRLVVINARTDKPILEMEGFLSISNNETSELVITYQTGANEYRVNYIYLNEWTLYTVEDISGSNVSSYHYEINFLPEMIMPFSITNSY